MTDSNRFSADVLDKVAAALRGIGAHDPHAFSPNLVARALTSRMRSVGVSSVDEYVSRLENSGGKEGRRLLEALSVGVTRFFRDPDVFDALARIVIPELVGRSMEVPRPIRIWVPGCASGEEAYSLAMLFLECDAGEAPEFRIHGTDVDEHGLKAARTGTYPRSIEHDIPPELLRRHMKQDNGNYRVSARLRAVCEFGLRDVNDPAPVAQADLISCRYVLMYLDLPARQRVLTRFFESLRAGGFLVLGSTEDINGIEDLFEPVEKRHGIYRAVVAGQRHKDDQAEAGAATSDTEAVPAAQASSPDMSVEEQLEVRNVELERLNRQLGFQVDNLETTLSLVPIGIAICEDTECETIRVNRAGSLLLGIPENINIGTSGMAEDITFSIRSRDDPDIPAELPIGRALETGEGVIDEELRVVRENGTEAKILVSVVPLKDDEGRTRGAVAAFVDNTDQHEERRRLAERHAAERSVSHLGIEMLSEHDVDSVMNITLDALVRELNVEVASVFEYRPRHGDFVLRKSTGLRGVEPSTASWDIGIEQADSSTIFVSSEGQLVPEWITEQGIVSAMATVVRSPGEPFGALGVFSRSQRQFTDVEVDFFETVASLLSAALERDHIERMLTETRDRLNLADAKQAAERAEQLAALGTLAAGISHEINNPLNSILVNAELGLLKLEKDQDPARIRSVLETIVEDVRRCARITESVLNLAKPSDTPKCLADLNDVVRQARDLVASHLQLHDSTVELDLGELPELNLDTNAMESAMVNLIRNAAEADRLGVKISISTRREGDSVTVEVRDNGPGISPEHLDHVFDPFFSTKRSTKGTGLGLSLVHNTVTDHGGTIRVESRAGDGTTFILKLPVPDRAEMVDDETAAR